MSQHLRFGLQLTGDRLADPVAEAVCAEALGFDLVLLADHVGPERLAPLPALAAIAAGTERIRLGTFVLNNDMRNPVQLAWEATTLDHLSNGRFELGLGAGHTPHEYSECGLDQDPPTVRKARLAESVEIIRRLLDGETVDHSGDHYTLSGAIVDRSTQERLPILVGGNGAALLGHAGAHADIIGLQGLGRTLEDGHRHRVQWSADRLTGQIEQIRAGAGDRYDQLELNVLVQVVTVTDDPDAAMAELCERIEGLTIDHLREIPYALIGSVDQIAAKITACHERWGISSWAVRDPDTFTPVINTLRN